MVTNPTFLRVPDPSNGTGQLTQHPSVALDQTVARWLREGAPRVNSRSNPNPANRPFIPAALFSFFDGAISLPQCSQLIAQHLANSSSHVRAAAQEFTRTEGAQKLIYTSTHGSHRLLQNLPSPTSPIPWQPPISRWSLASRALLAPCPLPPLMSDLALRLMPHEAAPLQALLRPHSLIMTPTFHIP